MASLQARCAELARRFRQRPDTSARTLLVTVYGDSIAPRGGEALVAALVRLMSPFGINERLTRTSLNRLVGEGLLTSRRIGRRSAYSVTPTACQEFWSAEQRIYQRRREPWHGDWIVLVELDELAGPARAALRQHSGWLGFAPIAPGVQLCPAERGAELSAVLHELGLGGQVAVFRARTDGRGGLDDRRLARRASDLDDLKPAYRAFVRRFRPLLDAGDDEALLPETAFCARTLLVHAWRRIVLHEPELPPELLPDDWVGETAYDVAGRLYHRLATAAEAHLDAAGETPTGPLPPLDPRYGGRFPPAPSPAARPPSGPALEPVGRADAKRPG